MAFSESLLFYLLIGIAVAVAVALASDRQDRGQRVFQAVTATLFWPLYLPILLSRSTVVEHERQPTSMSPDDESLDEFSASIAQVEAEMDAARMSLDGWAEGALVRDDDRFAELRSAWRVQAARIREMGRLLAAGDDALAARVESTSRGHDRAVQSERARCHNRERLRKVRDQACSDLTATLVSVRELVSMIHLAKFTGAPASRAEELIAQIAASVEGLTEVAAWSEPNVNDDGAATALTTADPVTEQPAYGLAMK